MESGKAFDNGKDFLDPNHQYAYNLDIFGDRSLFQWINVAKPMGRKALSKLLFGSNRAIQIKRGRKLLKNWQLSLAGDKVLSGRIACV